MRGAVDNHAAGRTVAMAPSRVEIAAPFLEPLRFVPADDGQAGGQLARKWQTFQAQGRTGSRGVFDRETQIRVNRRSQQWSQIENAAHACKADDRPTAPQLRLIERKHGGELRACRMTRHDDFTRRKNIRGEFESLLIWSAISSMRRSGTRS